MKKPGSKAAVERRKRPRSSKRRRAQGRSTHLQHLDSCRHCSTSLADKERALFVEEEVGRIFCSEKCIAAFFAPEIEKLEKEYFRHLSPNDLSGQERESLAHLRWITLQEPDEVWREKTLAGDHRFTLISQFQPGNKKVWSICICLFLRGEPSFLYLALSTKDTELVNRYRKGERIQWIRHDVQPGHASALPAEQQEVGSAEALSDRLATAWTEDETFRAQLGTERKEDDIPAENFALYQSCIEETLEEPDEVWSLEMGEDSKRLFHFIRYYKDETPAMWYVIVARETDAEEEIEILDAFPTRDLHLVNQYRRGEQEVSKEDSKQATSRVVH